MKKVNTLILTIFGLYFTYAQVGIGTSEPLGSLHVESSNNMNNTFIITNSNNDTFITNTKQGTIGINGLAGENLIKVNQSTTNSTMPTLQLVQMKNFETYTTVETDKIFGYAKGRVDLINTISANYNYASKTTTTGPISATTMTVDGDLVLELTPGVYEILGNIIYSAASDEDIEIGLKSSKNMSLSYFMGAGHYAEFDNASGSVPFVTKNITTANNVVPFGGAGKNVRLVAKLEGILEVTEPLTLKIIYKQQAVRNLTSNSATVYSDSFLFAKKIS